ncbi:MAG: glycosyltransferase family 2 protein [Candidatus Auribacter fodinae]|uniref:Glycosyltransferase family 2 protein n=1 Tax=Candidatus Auribacter fodinae TaxID=2093366 RepID=A0A3A4R947_9BACT|nr:MAG: glycosyltransferase family 2 protein [Candidatus Auribacter fodinae]
MTRRTEHMYYLMLPLYNEENAIVPLLENVEKVVPKLGAPLRVVIVDDGSADKSVERIKEYSKRKNAVSAEVIPHPKNMGLGQAMRTGIYTLAQKVNDDDIVFTMDADNTHNPEHMPSMETAVKAGHEVVVASRYCSGGEERGLKLYRSILSRGASTLLSIVFHCKGIRDYTCGYRAYSGRLLKEAYQTYGDQLITEDGFTCMAELLIKVHPLAESASEVPMVLRYDLKGGASKMKIMKTIIRYWHLIKVLKSKKIYKK